MLQTVHTEALEIGYEEYGKPDGPPIVLVHGWPDDVRCWDRVTPKLVQQGFHVLMPYLRGVGPTRFLSADTMRSGQIGALGMDIAQFLEHLDLRDVLLVGHDWGARAGYVASAIYPDRLRGLIAISAGYATNTPVHAMDYSQVQAYWYEWLIATKQGRKAFERDRQRLCHFLWHSWSPEWKFAESEFLATATSWDNTDWSAVSIHAYLHRWGEAPGDPELEDLEAALEQAPPIRVRRSFFTV
jgi:pimeloyl-ACP methyl ester carboxylesterase